MFISDDFGLTWKKIQDKIGYFSWSIEGVDLGEDSKTIFILRNEPSGISTLLSSSDLFASGNKLKVWLRDVEEIEMNGKFIFATRRLHLLGSSHKSDNQLWISVNRNEFFRAQIKASQSIAINYHIADVTPEHVFLAVTFIDGSTNLYKSGTVDYQNL